MVVADAEEAAPEHFGPGPQKSAPGTQSERGACDHSLQWVRKLTAGGQAGRRVDHGRTAHVTAEF